MDFMALKFFKSKIVKDFGSEYHHPKMAVKDHLKGIYKHI